MHGSNRPDVVDVILGPRQKLSGSRDLTERLELNKVVGQRKSSGVTFLYRLAVHISNRLLYSFSVLGKLNYILIGMLLNLCVSAIYSLQEVRSAHDSPQERKANLVDPTFCLSPRVS